MPKLSPKCPSKPSRDERRLLALVAAVLEGEGPEADGLGPLLRWAADLAEAVAERVGADVGELVGERMEAGRRVHGALVVANDSRDFEREALAGLVAAVAALGMAVLRRAPTWKAA